MLEHLRELHEIKPEEEAFVMKITVANDVQLMPEEDETAEN